MAEEATPGKPGILVRGLPPDKTDGYLLEAIELFLERFGSGEEEVVKKIEFSEDKTLAYVEFNDPSVIPQVLVKSDYKLVRKYPVTVEKLDLLNVWQPYLTVKNIPTFAKEDSVRRHFKAAANGAELQSIDLKEGEATIFYEDAKAALKVAPETQRMFGRSLTVEVSYCSPKPQEECALVVKGIPDDMDDDSCHQALEMYLNETTGQKVAFCEVVEDVAYIRFQDLSGVKAIVSQPPTEEFMAGVQLEMSSIPISRLPSSTREPTSPVDIPQQRNLEQQHDSVSPTSPPHLLAPSQCPLPGTSPAGGQQPGTWATRVERSSSPIPSSQFAPGTSALPHASSTLPPETTPMSLGPRRSSELQQQQYDGVSPTSPPHFPAPSRYPPPDTSSARDQQPGTWATPGAYEPPKAANPLRQFTPEASALPQPFNKTVPPGTKSVGQQRSSELQQQQYDGVSPTSHPYFPVDLSQSAALPGTSPAGGYQPGTWATRVEQSSSLIPSHQFLPEASALPHASPPGFQPSPSWLPRPGQSDPQPLEVEDVDTAKYPANDPGTTSKVIVKNFPPSADAFFLKLYLQNISQPVQCTGVDIRESGTALASFEGTIDMSSLIQRAKQAPFPENQVPTLSPLEPTKAILVSNLPENTADYFVKLFFTSLGCSVQDVTIRPPNHAVVTFGDHQSVQKVLSQPQLLFNSTPITAKEFYLFLDALPPDHPQPPPDETLSPGTDQLPAVVVPPPVRHIWGVQMKKVDAYQEHFLYHTLPQLNKELEGSNAKALIEKESGTTYLSIKPLPQAGELHDWEDEVTSKVSGHFTDFVRKECRLPEEARANVFEYTTNISHNHPELYIEPSGDRVIVAGNAWLVEQVASKVTDISQAAEVVSTNIELPPKEIKYLMKFCNRDMQSVYQVNYACHPEEGFIAVRANPMALQAFQDLLDQKVSDCVEETLRLSSEAYRLLSSGKGRGKIADAIPRISGLVYEFEQLPSADGIIEYQLCFLSQDRKLVRDAVKRIESYTAQKALQLSKEELNVCESADPGWLQCKEKLTSDFFVQITVSSDSVIVTGESIAVEGQRSVLTQIQQFLVDKVSVEDRFHYELSDWRVIKGSSKHKLDAVKQQAKDRKVQLIFPKVTSAGKAMFTLKGKPASVLDIKTQLGALKADIQVKVEKIYDVPGLLGVLNSLEDRFLVLEQKHNAVIEVDVESGENGASPTTTAQAVGERPMKVLTATSDHFTTELTIFTGNFTQLPPSAGTIVNFLSPDPNFKVGNLKTIIDAGGSEIQMEIHSRLSQSYHLRYAQVFRTKQGQLNCSQLMHTIIPLWKDGNQNEAGVFDEALSMVLRGSAQFGSVVIVPATTCPFNYPVNVFAEKVVEVVAASSAEVLVFIDDPSHANEFEKCLQAKEFQVVRETRRPPSVSRPHAASVAAPLTSGRSITSYLSTFITVIKGSLLDEQADIYVNSTNPAMKLADGKLASVLLKACGKELQDECNQYAPLQPGNVAVTGAKNVKCKKLFHVALPDYKATLNPERVFRETVQKLLRTAEAEQASSIAFPSLGVAGLHYPPEVSAKILLDEVIEFHARHPSVVKKFYFVIYEKDVHQIFTKVFAQRMTSGSRAIQGATSMQQDHSKGSKQVGSTQPHIVHGNIADETADVIVNTTAEDMNLDANAVSRAILKKAGTKLQSACRNLVDSGLHLGQGKIAVTKACGQLRCKKVIHAHIPVRSDAIAAHIDPKELVSKIVTACLQKADEDGMRSLSFPAFGTGAGGYAVDEIAEGMLQALQRFQEGNPKTVEVVRIVIFEQDQHDQFLSYFCKFFGKDSATPTQGSSGYLHSLKTYFGIGSQSKEGSSNPQAPKSRTVAVRGPIGPFAFEILPSHLVNSVAVFKIFASSIQTAETIATEVRTAVKKQVVVEEVEEEFVAFLFDDDIQEMVNLGDALGVIITSMARTKKITISGERSRVSEAKMKVIAMMRDIDRAKSEVQLFQWQSLDAGMPEPYPEAAAVRLERAYRKKIKLVELTIDNIDVLIDLELMTETAMATGTMHDVQRVNKLEAMDFPITWVNQPKDANGIFLPCHMEDIPAHSTEYQDAVREFQATLGSHTFTIVKVQRIQNPSEYAKHLSFRDALKRKYGKPVLEKKVFHGTKEDSMVSIAHQGFNRIFAADANAAVYGKGVYFAARADYSAQDQYSVPNKDGVKHIFVCNLIVGEFAKGSKGMKTAPSLPGNPLLLHDTLVDNAANPTIYVAMTDSQVYPEYLITFMK